MKRNESHEDIADKEPTGHQAELEFQCPECGYSGLNAYQKAWMVASDVECVCKDELMNYGMDDITRFGVALFECARCAYRLEGVFDGKDLVQWLKEHCGR